MKTISELQQEIRSMQMELQEINNRLSNINDALLNYKDSGINDTKYKRIYEIAETMPIIEHPIIHYGYTLKNSYFAILILVATCEDSINDEQLLFLQRMAMADNQRTSIDLYMAGIGSVSIENVIFKMHDDVKNLSNQLVLDMLMIANLGKIKSQLTYEVIANITKFIGVSEYELRMISVIAKSILLQRCDESVKAMGLGYMEKIDCQFGYYLSTVKNWKKYLIEKKEEEKKKKAEVEKRQREMASSLYDLNKSESHYLDNKPWI